MPRGQGFWYSLSHTIQMKWKRFLSFSCDRTLSLASALSPSQAGRSPGCTLQGSPEWPIYIRESKGFLQKKTGLSRKSSQIPKQITSISICDNICETNSNLGASNAPAHHPDQVKGSAVWPILSNHQWSARIPLTRVYPSVAVPEKGW